MIDEIQREFASLADSAADPHEMLESVHRRVAVRRGRRRLAAVAGTVGAVAVVAVGAVVITSRAPTEQPAAPVGVAITSSDTYLPGDPGLACSSGTYVPPPAPLVTVAPNPSTPLALGLVPQGWSVSYSDNSNVIYSDPNDPSPGSVDFAGKILIAVSSIPDQDTAYNTVINGHPATVQTSDPCTTAGYPGGWLVNMRYGSGIEVQLQGPMSLRLSDTQIREMAASIIARTLIPGKG